MHQSVATIDSPEFLNLQPLDINPLMSKCDIKVLYVGKNRNRTFINEQVATEIGKTLRGAPIVGYYRDTKEDFTDHGEKVIIDDEGIKFECQTKPYGFVSPDAKVWFQNFEDSDGMGNTVVHKYLMTTGYLWTTQFPESSLPVEQGRPQSMEFYRDSVKGEWQTNYEDNIEFFIINDAIVQKICILGDDVEPCFEGASVTAPDISTKFTLDDNFRNTLYSMMKDLKNVLDERGQQMKGPNEVEEVEVTTTYTSETEVEQKEETSSPEAASDYAKKDDQEEKKDSSENQDNKEDTSSEDEKKEDNNSDSNKENKEEDDDKKKKSSSYTALEEELNTLKETYNTLQTQYEELVNFKRSIDNQNKDALIAEFYMLSDEDKKDVIENKEKYSLEDIKAKLSVICFDKKISFALEDNKEEEQQVTTYKLEDNNDSNLPEWVRAVKEQEKLG